MREALLVFVRWPEPGHAKTRLAPRLGMAGAARAYRGMAERVLAGVRRLDRPDLTRVVWLSPPDRGKDVENWLGPGLTYRTQPAGDLGTRLQHAFARAFANGARSVVAVGTDCPDLTEGRIAAAFDALTEVDAVVGPALDGGYYLIGLSRPAEPAFRDIPWSTERTFEVTLSRLRTTGAAVRFLPPLRDVDRPEDLDAASPPLVSVVIPVLNEEREIGGCLEAVLAAEDPLDVVVVDGGSTDATPRIVRGFPGVHLVRGARGRGVQMNEGARHARGDVLWFLHSDCRLPRGAIRGILGALSRPGMVGGAFRFSVRSDRTVFRLIERLVGLRTELLVEPYGDQGIFVTRSAFHAAGGYPETPILEDIRFVRRLRTLGGFRVLPLLLPTSARRWQECGVLSTALRFQAIGLLERFGVRPERLAPLLRDERDAAPVPGIVRNRAGDRPTVPAGHRGSTTGPAREREAW